MSTSKDKAPAWYITLAPDILLDASEYPAGTVCLHYSGWPEDLLAAGVMRPEWIRPTGKRLRDPDGGKVSVSRRWRIVSPEAPPRRYCVIKRERPLSDLPRWPGALEALAVRERYDAWHREQYPHAHLGPEQAAERRAIVLGDLEPKAREVRPSLRLVVDNTRKSSLRIVGSKQEDNA